MHLLYLPIPTVPIPSAIIHIPTTKFICQLHNIVERKLFLSTTNGCETKLKNIFHLLSPGDLDHDGIEFVDVSSRDAKHENRSLHTNARNLKNLQVAT